MATPQMQQQTLNLTVARGSSKTYTTAAVKKVDDTAVDFTVGTWVFALKVRPLQPNLAAPSIDMVGTGLAITGDASGILSLAIDKSFSEGLDSLASTNSTFYILASNDAFSTYQAPVSGSIQLGPAPTVG